MRLLETLTTREPSSQAAAFLFVIESCEHQVERLECFCVSLGPAEGSTGDGRIQQLLTLCSVRFHPSLFTRPSFLREQD